MVPSSQQVYRSFDGEDARYRSQKAKVDQIEEELTGRLTAANESEGEQEFAMGDLGL